MSDASITLQDIRESQRWHESRDVERFTETSERLKSIVDVELANLKRDVTDIQGNMKDLKADLADVKKEVGELKDGQNDINNTLTAFKSDMAWVSRGVLALLGGVGGLFVTMLAYLLLK